MTLLSRRLNYCREIGIKGSLSISLHKFIGWLVFEPDIHMSQE
jgi:hypothetical protein